MAVTVATASTQLAASRAAPPPPITIRRRSPGSCAVLARRLDRRRRRSASQLDGGFPAWRVRRRARCSTTLENWVLAEPRHEPAVHLLLQPDQGTVSETRVRQPARPPGADDVPRRDRRRAASSPLVAGRLALAMLAVAGFTLIGLLGLWDREPGDARADARRRSPCALVIGIPLGIWSGRNPKVEKVLRPLLDAMQTMPAFVVPAAARAAVQHRRGHGLIATVIFALPPPIRLTSLGHPRRAATSLEVGDGVRRDDEAESCAKVQLPLARPSDHARRQPDDHDGVRDGRDRGDRRASRPRARGAGRAAAPGRRCGAERRDRDRRRWPSCSTG